MTNPLETSPKRDALILKRAELLWKEDGSPSCGPEMYLDAARSLVGMEENPDAGQEPVDPPRPIGPEGQPIEEAWLEDNLGESVSRLTDQGDRRGTPYGTYKEEAKGLDEE